VTKLFRAEFPVWGSTGVLALIDGKARTEALTILLAEIEAFDLACSRFRPDSELARLNSAPPAGPVRVSTLLLDAVDAALRAAAVTDGLVDPTVGTALEVLGYDRDFAVVERNGPAVEVIIRPVTGWKAVRIDRVRSTVTRPTGAHLDLGATAKARCADLAASRIADRLGTGVLVGLGGDVAVAGPPPAGGWSVKIADDHNSPIDSSGAAVSIASGGLATSSTTVRRWRRGSQAHHHLIDPGTGRPAAEYWRTVTVAAGSCLDANIASCASILLGERAVSWLAGRALPARLWQEDGSVATVAGWPDDRPWEGVPGAELVPC
jgi:thiamine biosynthesis lipoprotein